MSSNLVTENSKTKDFFAGHGLTSEQVPLSSTLGIIDFVYSLYDVCTGLYDAPFLSTNDATALRLIQDHVIIRDNMIQRHPEDFKLFCLGKFDKILGVMMPFSPKQICNIKELLTSKISQKGFTEDGELVSN